MTPTIALAVLRSLIADTFRQSFAGGIFWLMLAVTVLCVIFCAGVSFSPEVPLDRTAAGVEFVPKQDPLAPKLEKQGVDIVAGKIRYGFGVVEADCTRDRTQSVHFLLSVLAGGVAGAAGVLLTLVWTAGFLPAFLEPSAVSVLLAKPTPRWLLLSGKALGLAVFVAFQATAFVLGTWLALGMKTGVWLPGYLWCVPILTLHFSIYASMSILLAVLTRSTVVCVFGSILFWLMTWGMNYGRHATLAIQEVGSGAARPVVEAGYWLLPKPLDLNFIFMRAMEAGKHFPDPVDLVKLERLGQYDPFLSVISSLAFTIVILALAIRQFNQTDY